MNFKIIVLSIFFIIISISTAHARIDIVPQKILIDHRERNGEFTVLNLMNLTGTFRIEILNFEQNIDGVYKEINTPLNPNFDPQSIARMSPRQFTLGPNGRQKVRLSLRKPAELPEGEYRFHVKAMRLISDDERKNENANTVNVVANIGVTIPVIVRHGPLESMASIENIELIPESNTKTQKPEIHLNINRNGSSSTLGLLEILWRANNQKNAKRIGRITNMNIFTDIETRRVHLPLYEMPKGSGTLTVRYADTINKGVIFDEKNIQF